MIHKTNLSFLLRAVLFQLALLVATTVVAHDFEVDGIYYKITGSEVSVTYRGQYATTYVGEYTDTVTIPESVTYNGTTYMVTSIDYSAFSGCTELTSVTIPSTVTIINSYAFTNCSGLTKITVPLKRYLTRLCGLPRLQWIDQRQPAQLFNKRWILFV